MPRAKSDRTRPIPRGVDSFDWPTIAADLDSHGCVTVGPLFTAAECDSLCKGFDSDELYRKRVVMAQHGFGRGEYKYFDYPLPPPIAELRAGLYPHLAEVANRWSRALGSATSYPADLESFTKRCHKAGQKKPTPLVLRYEPGDYNCLHQDLYGEHVFPLQVTILLSDHDRDFTGGEFVLTEQRPRMQSRVEVVPLRKGHGVIFAVRDRPVQGSRGYYRVNMRHGVSRVRSGLRFTAGIIFHDAK